MMGELGWLRMRFGWVAGMFVFCCGLAAAQNPSTGLYVLNPPPGSSNGQQQSAPQKTVLVPKTGKRVDISGRIVIATPASAVIGVPLEIPFTVQGGELKTMIVGQRQSDGSPVMKFAPDGDDLNPMIVRNGKYFLRVTPVLLGRVEIHYLSVFADGGFGWEHVALTVIPPAELPSRFWFSGVPGRFGDTTMPTVSLSLQHPVGGNLGPLVKYPGVPRGVSVAPDIHYSVRSSAESEVVKFNARYGSYLPVGLGHALITGTYGGLIRKVCIVVSATDAKAERRSTACSDLEQ
jgi:hypothetical protein